MAMEQLTSRVAVEPAERGEVGAREVRRDEVVHVGLGRVPLAHVARRLVQQAERALDLKRRPVGFGDHLDAGHDLVLRVADERAIDVQPFTPDPLLRALERQPLGARGVGVRLQQVVETHFFPTGCGGPLSRREHANIQRGGRATRAVAARTRTRRTGRRGR